MPATALDGEAEFLQLGYQAAGLSSLDGAGQSAAGDCFGVFW